MARVSRRLRQKKPRTVEEWAAQRMTPAERQLTMPIELPQRHATLNALVRFCEWAGLTLSFEISIKR